VWRGESRILANVPPPSMGSAETLAASPRFDRHQGPPPPTEGEGVVAPVWGSGGAALTS